MDAFGLRFGLALGIVGALASCGFSDVFNCAASDDCGPGGLCEADGVCSFPDPECSSGRRYGDHAGGLSGLCVAPLESTDAGTTTQMTGSSSPATTAPTISAGSDTTEPITATSGEMSGSESSTTGGGPIVRVDADLLLLYTFDEGVGNVVTDVSGVLPAMDLTLVGGGFSWDSGGLVQTSLSSIALVEGSATKLHDGCQATDEITVEVWVTSAAPDQQGPARIITYSTDINGRNFLLGEGTDTKGMRAAPGYSARLRTTESSNNGLPFVTWDGKVATEPTHLVFTRDIDGNETLYVDTVVFGEQVKLGTFATWDPTYELALGNELTLTRGWLGAYHLVAVFSRALTTDEVQQNFTAGY